MDERTSNPMLVTKTSRVGAPLLKLYTRQPVIMLVQSDKAETDEGFSDDSVITKLTENHNTFLEPCARQGIVSLQISQRPRPDEGIRPGLRAFGRGLGQHALAPALPFAPITYYAPISAECSHQ